MFSFGLRYEVNKKTELIFQVLYFPPIVVRLGEKSMLSEHHYSTGF